jgi:hypothetical protein
MIISQDPNGGFTILFETPEAEHCTHRKHIAHMLDYDFLFCKDTQQPIAVYTGKEIKTVDDVGELMVGLAEKFTVLLGSFESPYFNSLAKAIIDSQDIKLV